MKVKNLYRLKQLVRDTQNLWKSFRERLYKIIGLYRNPYEFFYETRVLEKERKSSILRRSRAEKTICFTFRGIHWIDFFIPIHLALQRLYGDSYCVLYLSDLGSILQRHSGDTLAFYQQVRVKLREQGLPTEIYFDTGELYLFNCQLAADMLLFSDNMNHIKPDKNSYRVYLPHYSVLKAKDRQTFSSIKHLDFNHIFVPSRGSYFYTESQMRHNNPAVQIHHIGYPKFELSTEPVRLFPDGDTVIYAPSLEKEIIFSALDQGILDIFASLTESNFLIKLHPSIAGYKSGIVHLFANYEKKYRNIKVDKMMSIHKFMEHSKLLVTDFGSLGVEYKLLTGKPVIYLTVPEHYCGGSDLEFRDDYAAATVSMSQLKSAMLKHLDTQDSSERLRRIRKDTVFNYSNASEVAARTIHTLLG